MRLSLTEGCRRVLGWLVERLSDVEPEIRDGIAAATEPAAGERADIEDYVSAMVALIEIVRETVPAQTFVEIGQALSCHPSLKELARDQVS